MCTSSASQKVFAKQKFILPFTHWIFIKCKMFYTNSCVGISKCMYRSSESLLIEPSKLRSCSDDVINIYKFVFFVFFKSRCPTGCVLSMRLRLLVQFFVMCHLVPPFKLIYCLKKAKQVWTRLCSRTGYVQPQWGWTHFLWKVAFRVDCSNQLSSKVKQTQV